MRATLTHATLTNSALIHPTLTHAALAHPALTHAALTHSALTHPNLTQTLMPRCPHSHSRSLSSLTLASLTLRSLTLLSLTLGFHSRCFLNARSRCPFSYTAYCPYSQCTHLYCFYAARCAQKKWFGCGSAADRLQIIWVRLWLPHQLGSAVAAARLLLWLNCASTAICAWFRLIVA